MSFFSSLTTTHTPSGHCKHLTPEYKKLGAAVAADPALATRVVVAKVDADQHRALGERFAVRGFPTIKLFRRGAPVTGPEDYAGARTADAMLAHVKSVLAADRGHARVAALDALHPATAPLAKLEAAAKKLDGQDAAHGALYVSIAKKGAAKGEGWFAKEAARVERLLGSGAVGGARLQELTTKLSVLSAFVGEEDGVAAAA